MIVRKCFFWSWQTTCSETNQPPSCFHQTGFCKGEEGEVGVGRPTLLLWPCWLEPSFWALTWQASAVSLVSSLSFFPPDVQALGSCEIVWLHRRKDFSGLRVITQLKYGLPKRISLLTVHLYYKKSYIVIVT